MVLPTTPLTELFSALPMAGQSIGADVAHCSQPKRLITGTRHHALHVESHKLVEMYLLLRGLCDSVVIVTFWGFTEVGVFFSTMIN